MRIASRPSVCPMSSAVRRTMRSTFVIGMPKVWPPACTSRQRVVATLSGTLRVNFEPSPSVLSTSIMPWRRSMCSRTTSMPTPRPERSVTSCLVEKPERKMSHSASRSLMPSAASAVRLPFSIALALTFSTSMPAPSSMTSITRSAARWAARRTTRPSRDLPAEARVSASSMPWSMQLRTMCVRGERSCSSTCLSTSVSPPWMSSVTSLFSSRVRSRTMRGKLSKTVDTGSMRVRRTSSWRSVVTCAMRRLSASNLRRRSPRPPRTSRSFSSLSSRKATSAWASMSADSSPSRAASSVRAGRVLRHASSISSSASNSTRTSAMRCSAPMRAASSSPTCAISASSLLVFTRTVSSTGPWSAFGFLGAALAFLGAGFGFSSALGSSTTGAGSSTTGAGSSTTGAGSSTFGSSLAAAGSTSAFFDSAASTSAWHTVSMSTSTSAPVRPSSTRAVIASSAM